MADILCELGRRQIFFTDHALDRYWQRHLDDNPNAGRKQARAKLRQELPNATWQRTPPPWAYMTIWHRARCEGVVMMDEGRCFIVNKNPSGDLVAVTFISDQEELNGRAA